MGSIQTFTGLRFSPDDPRPENFDIRDVAHALSLLCRFNGHCHSFYSVAEHSVRVSRACPPEAAKWGLLHDLGEAYIGDMPRPIKAYLPAFVEFEDRLLQAAAQSFGLPWPMPPAVKQADDLLLVTELRDLMGNAEEPLSKKVQPLAETIRPLAPVEAEQAFLERYRELS